MLPTARTLTTLLLLVVAAAVSTGAAAPTGGAPAAAVPGTAGFEAADGDGGSGDGGSGGAGGLSVLDAVVLGIVEGVTEYLPVSSTGHLLVTQELLGVGTTPETEDAADTYAITIQAGAILAVAVLYAGRLRSMAAGVLGRDPQGRGVAAVLAVAVVPAVAAALAFEGPIKDRLFGPGPVVAAWLVGGVAILVASRLLAARPPGTLTLESVPLRVALAVGAAQALALWPGVSRSLVTILAALFCGLAVRDALELSFLLGLVVLTGATAYEAAAHGGELLDTFGLVVPLVGFAVAFVSAVVAVRWLVGYLGRHGLELFGWYRIALALVALVLLATGVL
ncbi:MAG: undecaprenyl-diphosphatase 2 [Acidimicrobiia bacterium]|nr:MAG: undecaprenyl-diphosphatase 2 [Acidimicrobiia bacterium]